MGEIEVAAFLTHLSVNRNVAPATQGQALNGSGFYLPQGTEQAVRGNARYRSVEKEIENSRGSHTIGSSDYAI